MEEDERSSLCTCRYWRVDRRRGLRHLQLPQPRADVDVRVSHAPSCDGSGYGRGRHHHRHGHQHRRPTLRQILRQGPQSKRQQQQQQFGGQILRSVKDIRTRTERFNFVQDYFGN